MGWKMCWNFVAGEVTLLVLAANTLAVPVDYSIGSSRHSGDAKGLGTPGEVGEIKSLVG